MSGTRSVLFSLIAVTAFILQTTAFESTVEGVTIEIPIPKLSSWSKATKEEQRIISKYWGRNSLGVLYPAVIGHAKEGAPLFVFALSYDPDISKKGEVQNLSTLCNALKKSFADNAKLSNGEYSIQTNIDTEASGSDWRGYFISTTVLASPRNIINKAYSFNGGIILRGRVFYVQAFTMRTDEDGRLLFQKILKVWLKDVVQKN